jgi:hypothetical protein
MFRLLAGCTALTAAVLTASAPAAHAQTRQYDGYCYVRSGDDDVTASSARCLNGEYYAYTDGYKPAPRAPEGYEVAYFTHRPGRDSYTYLYNASTLTQNFDPGAGNHFGNGAGNGRAYASADGDRSQDGTFGNGDVQPGAVNDDRAAGWRDDLGQWHLGRPAALGWRDEAGDWHEGQVAAYGWQDDQGDWHEAQRDTGY